MRSHECERGTLKRAPRLGAGGQVAELGRREAGVALEHGAEVALVRESAHQGDFRERLAEFASRWQACSMRRLRMNSRSVVS